MLCWRFNAHVYTSCVYVVIDRDGLQKLRDVYVQNNKLGDPKTLDDQLESNAQELDKLQQTLRKYQVYEA